MREIKIKFRFWNKIAHKFQSPSKYAIDGNGDLVAYDYETGAYDEPVPFSRTCIVAQQYTGHKDKNDVEIYEGDIVNHWIDLGPGGEKQITNQIVIGEWGSNLESWTYMEKLLPELIGNIFENPELLK